ncbi:hypothetical protein BJ138DRAFT_1159371 [Hygrophoropsis aurantiaca]|uniref:Uncharacterized protein n=1 Tax=Hygrophoropsis aurantiaca TaxID=72124 RepID=A0ACB8A3I6_9AGAM|nr:hypothetical protein BJ138DRAFT_1159371 [Hygrophoropsis aurantiaca]
MISTQICSTSVTALRNPNSYVNMYLTMAWASNIFLLTMQAILVVRVYALFNWSKKVLIFLATSYVLQAIITFVLTGLDANKQVYDEYITSVGPAIGNVQLVSVNPSAHPHVINFIILSIVFDTVLLLFALWAFVKHALQAKTPEGGWSINVLVKTLVADYLLYFVCNLLWLSLSLVTAYSTTESDVFHILHYYVLVVFNTLVVVAGPRMVISLRSIENKTRGEGGTLAGELSTLQFVIRELPTQLESVMEEGNGFRAMDGHAPID